MPIISKLKSLVGLDSGERSPRGTTVTVEREATESERAVTESAPSDSEAPEPAVDGADDPVDTVSGIGPAYAERLADAGVETVGDLASADAADLATATGLGEGRIAGWIDQVRNR